MARLRLTVGEIAVSTEQETGTISFSSDDSTQLNYNVSLVNFKLLKKMYQPTEIIATLHIFLSEGKEWKPVDNKKILKAFNLQRVSLNVVEVISGSSGKMEDAKVIDTIGTDFYVHEVIPTYKPTSLYVELKIYSLDKLLTLSNYCNSWTAKKLSAHILDNELPKYKLPYDSDKHVECDTSQMKHLVKDGQEHIFPYLVQYNESFYDMLIRTCNRWGEFVYWEDGKLHIGYDTSNENIKDVKGFNSMTFHDNTSNQPISAGSTYVSEATYDDNVLNSTVKKDGAAIVFGTIKNSTDLETGADYYWLRKAGQLLTNNKSIMNFLFDTAVNDLLSLVQTEALVSQYNDKHNDDYFKKKKKYVSMLDEQYDTSKEVLNQFSESDPILKAKDYAKILVGEMLAEQNIVDIDYDTTWPGLKLGNVIKVNDQDFIVVEISSQIKVNYELKVDRESGKVVKEPVKTLVFHVTAIAKNEDTFYPMMIPSGHIRTSGPQVAVVVDVEDPNKTNRVRVKYPWQLTSVNPEYEKITAKDIQDKDISDATPWLIYSSANGPAAAGVHGRHYLAEKVLVNYANNNVERPFVVGAVSTATPTALKTGSVVLRAPNGEYIKVHEGMGKGATGFIANLTPGLGLINGFLDIPDIIPDFIPAILGSNKEIGNAFEGGVEIGDKYGIWKITGSTDRRAIDINSPWGNVSINAFTGISVNAPNGDISIKGKNVSIEAGNNLTLTSGTNIRNKFLSSYGDGAAFNIVSFGNDVETKVAKKMASLVESVFDLSLIRSFVEVYWKPQEGALTVQSNRYLKLSAGGAKAGYPDAAYKNPKTEITQDDVSKSGMLKMGPTISEIIGQLPNIVDKMIARYQENYRDCIAKKDAFVNARNKLIDYSNNGAGIKVCNDYTDLKNLFWDPAKKEIAESDMAFSDLCKSDSIEDVAASTITNAELDINIRRLIGQKSTNEKKKYILKKRKEYKQDMLKKANALLKSIAKLRTEPQRLGDVKAYGIGRFLNHAPADYIKALQDAISAEKCKDTAFFKYAYNEDNAITDNRAYLTDAQLNGINFHRKALIRQIALNLVEGWGMESQAIKFALQGNQIVETNAAQMPAKPTTEADLEDENKWNLYARSLQFAKVVNESGGILDAVVSDFDPSTIKVLTPINEYSSWANAKSGQILFGTGSTYSLKPDGSIAKIDAKYNQARLSKALLSGKEEGAYDLLNSQVQRALKSLCAYNQEFEEVDDPNAVGVVNNQVENNDNNDVDEIEPLI